MNSEVKDLESSTDDAFRLEVEGFFSKAGSKIDATAEGIGDADTTALGRAKSFQLALSEAGLAGITYSEEYGGAGLTDRHQEIFSGVASGWDSPTSPFQFRMECVYRC